MDKHTGAQSLAAFYRSSCFLICLQRRADQTVTAEDYRRLGGVAAALAAGGEVFIEVAHEARFRQWPPLRQGIEARDDELRQRAELERWAQDWVHSDRKDSYLLRDERLKIAQQWAEAHNHSATFSIAPHTRLLLTTDF